jgi:hypothetical protein
VPWSGCISLIAAELEMGVVPPDPGAGTPPEGMSPANTTGEMVKAMKREAKERFKRFSPSKCGMQDFLHQKE